MGNSKTPLKTFNNDGNEDKEEKLFKLISLEMQRVLRNTVSFFYMIGTIF